MTHAEKTNGLEIFLVDDKNVTIARYGFDAEKLKNVNSIAYHSNDVKIHFGGISPTTKSELGSVGGCFSESILS